MAMEEVLDFERDLDVALLDQVISVFYDMADPRREEADRVMTALLEHPLAWTRVDSILEKSASENTKFFGLKILESTIKYRWQVLPKEQREGIRNYIATKVISMSEDEDALASREKRMYISKLNLALVQVLKQEWPHNWESFIPELVTECKRSVSVCENNMHVLKLLSEEVFDFSKDQMTTAKVEHLKKHLNKEFQSIFELCMLILESAEKPSLLSITLQTLLRFLSWIPLGYIFETSLIEALCVKFFATPEFRVEALACLTEIASINAPEYEGVFVSMYVAVMNVLVTHIPPESDVGALFADATDEGEMLIKGLSLFFGAFFKSHRPLLEKPDTQAALLAGMDYLVRISDVDEDEIFKICLEYWYQFTNELYSSDCRYVPSSGGLGAVTGGMAGLGGGSVGGGAGGGGGVLAGGGGRSKVLYAPILSRVRVVMISHMAKPEEVLIKEDDSGDIVVETQKDTDVLARYKTMRDTLVYLTHLNYEDTEKIMLDKLARQVDDSEFGIGPLNTLCWAIGSISGAMNEEDEKRFVVTVIKDLLRLCELKRGKKNKAVIASCIMYVVGQYPRFLRAHWKFLKTVVNKLFEFMHERHPGVQDMACDTFLKISQKCKRKFVMIQPGEPRSFIDELCDKLPATISDLQMHQIHSFYESAGCMVAAHPDPAQREATLERLMALPNSMWARVMEMAAADVESLQAPDAVREVQRILRTNVRVCRSVGPAFVSQMARLYLDMLNVYKAYSDFIAHSVATTGELVTQHSIIKLMRGAKREALLLVQTFVERCDDPATISTKFVPHMLEPVLTDFSDSAPAARDADVLVCLSACVERLKLGMADEVPRILGAVMPASLDMIAENMDDNVEIRRAFFGLLDVLNKHAFVALFSIPPDQQKLVVDSVLWAIKHNTRDISETGLGTLQQMLDNVVAAPDLAPDFFAAHFINILQETLYVLTDRMHKSGFKMQASILRALFMLVESGTLATPLWPDDAPEAAEEGMTNPRYLRGYVKNLLSTSFDNLTAAQVDTFVEGLFDMSRDLPAYKTLLRDFLVELLEFKGDDNYNLLYLEEAEKAEKEELERRMAVPGLLQPYEAKDDDDLADL